MIEIDRLRLHLRATAAPQRLHALESRVREAMSTTLPTALAGLFDRNMTQSDADVAAEPLVFIDRLEFVSALNSAWDGGALGQAMARPLSTRIRALVEHGGEGVRRFEDRAAWLAEFMLELTNGTAWRRWWFDAFDGLRPLTLPAALRTVIINERDVAVTALLRLPQARLDGVIDALGSTECGRVLAGWADRQPAQELPLHRLWQAATSLHGKEPAGLLHAALALERSVPGSIGARTLAVLAALGDLLQQEAEASRSPSDSPALALAGLCASAHINSAWLAHLDAAEQDALKALLRDAQHAAPFPDAAGDNADTAPGSAEPWQARTAHGGAFVMLMVMSWLRWQTVWQRAFASFTETAAVADELARTLSLAVIGRALHPARPDTVTRDPTLVEVWGIAAAAQQLADHERTTRLALRATGARPRQRRRREDERDDALGPWLEGAAQRLLAAMAERIPGCTGATNDYLRRNLLVASASVVRLAGSTGLEVTMTRPPLHVLLLIAGLTQGQAWLGSQKVRMHTEDAT
jgi:hypothetical protein